MSVGDRLKDQIILARQIAWHYQLEDYTEAALKPILKSLDTATKEIVTKVWNQNLQAMVTDSRAEDILEELQDLTFGIKAKLTGDIVNSSVVAGEASLREYGDILSFRGAVTDTIGFNFVALAPEQLKSMVLKTPVGGRLLTDWVNRTFAGPIIQEMDSAILTGYLKGEGVEKIVNRLTSSFDIIRRDAETLARTYIADANNRAAKAVYDANDDIVKAEEWNATLEVNAKHGRGTCIRCASLDGNVYPLNEPHIRPPLHANCRCFLTPKTASYKELGLNIDELKTEARAYTTKDGKKILKAGEFDGDFEDFLKKQGYQYQKDLLGPNRLRMWKDGTIKFDDIVDDVGNVRLLKKGKEGGYVGLVN